MIQAMYNGVSGLRAHKTMMDVISNNIANVNTVGYKAAQVSFREAFSQTLRGGSAPSGGGVGGTNPAQLGLGVAVGSVDVSQNQGSLQPTGKLTDLAVEGNGFFILSDGSSQSYSRDGSFTIDRDGNLVSSSGLKVLGWMANPQTGVINTLEPVNPSMAVRVPVGQLSRQTSQITYGGNLDSKTIPGETRSVSALIYDSLGTAHTLSLEFEKIQNPLRTQESYANPTDVVATADTTLSVILGKGTSSEQTTVLTVSAGTTAAQLAALIDGAGNVDAELVDRGASVPPAERYYISAQSDAGDGRQVTIPPTGTVSATFCPPTNKWTWSATEAGLDVGIGTLNFDGTGKNPTSTGGIVLNLQNGASAPLSIKVNFEAISQLSGPTTVSGTSQDGLPLGMLETFTIGKDGVISGVFTNGQSQALAQVALATFNNPGGLSKIGNNVLVESSNSGPAQIHEPAVGSMGRVMGGFLESSNVDLPTEFANMIVAQRGFQANSRIITTSDEILMELVQLKR